MHCLARLRRDLCQLTMAPKKGAYTGHKGLISVEASADAIVKMCEVGVGVGGWRYFCEGRSGMKMRCKGARPAKMGGLA